jgi:hypothetical protein
VAEHFVLVDFENVQPKNLAALAGKHLRVKVFVGASQSKVPFELARALQALGPDAEYIQADGSGSNALDFHVAFYIGRLAAQHPGATFQIVSKDTGFDPLIRHLRKLGIECHRSKAVETPATPEAPRAPAQRVQLATRVGARAAPVPRAEAPKPRAPRVAAAAAPAPTALTSPRAQPAPVAAALPADGARVDLVIANLAKRKSGKPRTLKTLGSAIRSLFPERLSDVDLNALLDQLKQRRVIVESGGKVTYPG